MPSSFRAALAVMLLLGSGVAAAAEDDRAGDLVIGHPWTRATPKGATVAGGYLTITNRGATADTLEGGSLAVAAAAEVHEMKTVNGVMTMRPAGPVAIPPGGSVTLAPAGLHLMFTGLKRGLKKGETVEGTLVFGHSGTVPVRFTVEALGARAPAGEPMPGMDMH